MTAGQREVLHALTHAPKSAREIAAGIPHGTYDHAHSALRRLEDRELVRRTGAKHVTGQTWELTAAGRHALEQTT